MTTKPPGDAGIPVDEVVKTAVVTTCGTYRYWLKRIWDESRPMVGFLMLNPSTADHRVDDPTIRKCIHFAREFDHGGIWVVNLFALRSTNPDGLKKVADPVGPQNDRHIREMLAGCPRAIVAYGACHPKGLARVRAVEQVLLASETPTFAFAYTLHGFPRHPLYLPNASTLQRFVPAPEGAVV